jgi:hypothetical protein
MSALPIPADQVGPYSVGPADNAIVTTKIGIVNACQGISRAGTTLSAALAARGPCPYLALDALSAAGKFSAHLAADAVGLALDLQMLARSTQQIAQFRRQVARRLSLVMAASYFQFSDQHELTRQPFLALANLLLGFCNPSPDRASVS